MRKWHVARRFCRIRENIDRKKRGVVACVEKKNADDCYGNAAPDCKAGT